MLKAGNFNNLQTARQQATKNRLDIRLAKQELDAAAARQGPSLVSSFTDIELGIRRDINFDAVGHSDIKRGVEVSLRLPVFDWGGAQRTAMNAKTLAASYRLQDTVDNAGSHLRVSYSAYRSMYDIARQYRDEILPLRKRISAENQLRYNGMFIACLNCWPIVASKSIACWQPSMQNNNSGWQM